jgi:flagellar export protein FliJ
MQAFHFRLERILTWYRNLADLEGARLTACYANLSRALQAIAQLRAARVAAEQGVIRSATILPQDLMALSSYRLHAKLRESELEIERRDREKAMEEQRDRLIAIQRQVKLLEKLRGRRAEEHRDLMERELEAVAADAFIAKWLQDGARS